MKRKTVIALGFVAVMGVLFATPVQADEVDNDSGYEYTDSTYDTETEVESPVYIPQEPEGVKIDKETFGAFYEYACMSDMSNDGYLSDIEIKFSNCPYTAGKTTDLTGLEQFTAAEEVIVVNFSGKELSMPKGCKHIKTMYVNPTASSIKIKAPDVKHLIICEANTKSEAELMYTYTYEVGPTRGAVKKVDTSACKKLTTLSVCIENISQLTLPGKNNNLRILELSNLAIKTISLSNATKVEYLSVKGCEKLTKLNTSAMKSLKAADVYFCPKLTKFDFSKSTNLKAVATDKGTSVSLPKGKNVTWYLDQSSPKVYDISTELGKKYEKPYTSIGRVAGSHMVSEDEQKKVYQITKKNFPVFYKELKTYDDDKDGWLSGQELRDVTRLTVRDAVSNLSEIEKLPKLESITVQKYTGKTLTIKNKSLERVRLQPFAKTFTVNAPYVKVLDITPLTVTESGGVWNSSNEKSPTTSVDVSKCKGAYSVSVSMPNVSKLKLPSYKKNLAILNLHSLKIKSMNLGEYKNLQYLCCYYCENLPNLDLKKNTKLVGLWYTTNQNRSLDLSKNKLLEELCTNDNHVSKVTFAKGADVNWSKRYNYGAYKIESRIERKYGL